jgi:hypothetical protein
MSALAIHAPSRIGNATTRVSPLIELRRYTLQPNARDTLVTLFEREFIETQEACGIELIGQFHDLDAADRFVWLRGFPDPARRAEALAAFYGGPVWRAHRNAANATMIDSDDVHQLRPCRPAGGFALARRAELETRAAGGVLLAHLYPLRDPDPGAFLAFFVRAWVPLLWDANVGVGASYVSDPRPNDFPALPVRADRTVFVWFSRHADAERADAARARIDEALDWAPAIAAEHDRHLAAPAELLRLAPTPRSRLRA